MQTKKWLVLVGVVVMMALSSCVTTPQHEDVAKKTGDVDSYLCSLSKFPSATVGESIVEPVATNNAIANHLLQVPNSKMVIRKVQKTYGIEEHMCLQPNSSVIYPGALLDGASVIDGVYTPLLIRRAPLTISVSFRGVGSVSTRVENPSLSTVREAINKLASQIPIAQQGVWTTASIERVRNQQELTAASQITMKSSGSMGISGLFNFSTGMENVAAVNLSVSNVKNRILFKFFQILYSIDVDMPMSPKDFFASDVTVEEIRSKLGGKVCPVYVSSVKYGRAGYVAIESSYSQQEIEWALKVVLSMNVSVPIEGINVGGTNETTAGMTNKAKTILDNSQIKVWLVGTAAGSISIINGFENLREWIISTFSASSDLITAVPIAYTLTYLSDNTYASIFLTTEYYEIEAIPRISRFRVKFLDGYFDINPSRDFGVVGLPLSLVWDWKVEVFDGGMRTYSKTMSSSASLSSQGLIGCSSFNLYMDPYALQQEEGEIVITPSLTLLSMEISSSIFLPKPVSSVRMFPVVRIPFDLLPNYLKITNSVNLTNTNVNIIFARFRYTVERVD